MKVGCFMVSASVCSYQLGGFLQISYETVSIFQVDLFKILYVGWSVPTYWLTTKERFFAKIIEYQSDQVTVIEGGLCLELNFQRCCLSFTGVRY